MIYKTSDLLYALTSTHLLIVDGNTVDDLIEIMESYPNKPKASLWSGADIIMQGHARPCKPLQPTQSKKQ